MFSEKMGSPLDIEQSEARVAFSAGPATDFFRDPASERAIANAPLLWRPAPERFTLTAHVRPDLASNYDAGALFFYTDDEHWAKLAYEQTDIGYPAVVSVVTHGRSDDCNGEPWQAGEIWLRLSRSGVTLGLYYGADGREWKMHRLLRVPAPPTEGKDSAERPRVGLSVQSPTGAGCRVAFEDITWSEEPVLDFRKGR
jgi:regulation of enolase protein 1 (concanavalin A-like superfamily)